MTSLVTALAQDNREAYSICYQKAVNRLVKVGENFSGRFTVNRLILAFLVGY